MALLAHHWIVYPGHVWRLAGSKFSRRPVRRYPFTPYAALAWRNFCRFVGHLHGFSVWAGERTRFVAEPCLAGASPGTGLTRWRFYPQYYRPGGDVKSSNHAVAA